MRSPSTRSETTLRFVSEAHLVEGKLRDGLYIRAAGASMHLIQPGWGLRTVSP